MEADKIQSYVRMYQQSGIMPTFALASGNYACMNGNHAAPWFADAWFKGVRNFDLDVAYEGVRNALCAIRCFPGASGRKGPLDDFYAAHGYMPALRPGEKETDTQVHPFEKRQPVPVTLENSFDDWNIAQIARELKKPDDEQLFLKRAANYKNLFRADKGLMWPKDAEGKWIEPLDPKFDGGMGGRDYYDENNGYTYTWDVAQDFDGLITMMGGAEKAEANLDQLFREPLGRSKYEFQAKFPDSTSMVGQFSMGNEPSLVIPYIYNRVGAPWKTQKRVRMLLESFFTDTLQGIPGDEDGGGMSAFVVFSMLGFYPVTPGIPVYDVGSPVFDKATIHLKNGKRLRHPRSQQFSRQQICAEHPAEWKAIEPGVVPPRRYCQWRHAGTHHGRCPQQATRLTERKFSTGFDRCQSSRLSAIATTFAGIGSRTESASSNSLPLGWDRSDCRRRI